jgi:hypothetical protein
MPDNILKTLCKTKRGAAPGPFCNPIYLYRILLLSGLNRSELMRTKPQPIPIPQLTLTCHTSQPFYSNKSLMKTSHWHVMLPSIAITSLTYTNIPMTSENFARLVSEVRCITAALAITVLSGDAAQFLLLPQGQLVIVIPSGLDLVIHSTMADLEQHLCPNAHTRTLLLLNIINMFNTVSCKACHSVLAAHAKCSALIPFFDILYSVKNPCWYRQPDGSFATFDQAEGSPRDALSAPSSSLV